MWGWLYLENKIVRKVVKQDFGFTIVIYYSITVDLHLCNLQAIFFQR